MDEFLKVSPGKKRLIEVLDTLKPFEEVRIIADQHGKFDTFLVIRSSKIIITGLFETPIK